VTKGLRKVDKSEMTHKNPSLRLGSVVPGQTVSNTGMRVLAQLNPQIITFVLAAKKPVKPIKPQSLMGKKPSKFALESNKWVIVVVPLDNLHH
jgi:adenylyl cyclase-associated protein